IPTPISMANTGRGSIVEKQYMREYGLWSGRQVILIFSLLMIFCLGFYVMGLYVGRWSSLQTSTLANVETKAVETKAQPTQTTRVATPVDTANTPSATETQPIVPPTSEQYSVQIATATTQSEADDVVNKLRRAGFDSAHIVAPEPNSVAQFYVVRVGPYKLEI